LLNKHKKNKAKKINKYPHDSLMPSLCGNSAPASRSTGKKNTTKIVLTQGLLSPFLIIFLE